MHLNSELVFFLELLLITQSLQDLWHTVRQSNIFACLVEIFILLTLLVIPVKVFILHFICESRCKFDLINMQTVVTNICISCVIIIWFWFRASAFKIFGYVLFYCFFLKWVSTSLFSNVGIELQWFITIFTLQWAVCIVLASQTCSVQWYVKVFEELFSVKLLRRPYLLI